MRPFRLSLPLKVAEEAVAIYRHLAAQEPDAFLPDLAWSLGMYGRLLVAAGASAEALPHLEEGIRHLLPFVERHPTTFEPLASLLLDEYLNAAETLGEYPDEHLLEAAWEAGVSV